MNRRVTEVLARYEEQSQRESPIVAAFSAQEYVEQRDRYLLDIGAASGAFLNVLIKAARPRLIVEIGTSYGYSTVWLAEAAGEVRGRVVSIETSEAKIRFAQERIEEAGLGSAVEFVQGDALEVIASLKQEVNFALVDLWKELYIPAVKALHARLADGAIIAADNICRPAIHAPFMQAYVSHIRSVAGMQSVTVPIGSGIELSRYTKVVR